MPGADFFGSPSVEPTAPPICTTTRLILNAPPSCRRTRRTQRWPEKQKGCPCGVDENASVTSRSSSLTTHPGLGKVDRPIKIPSLDTDAEASLSRHPLTMWSARLRFALTSAQPERWATGTVVPEQHKRALCRRFYPGPAFPFLDIATSEGMSSPSQTRSFTESCSIDTVVLARQHRPLPRRNVTGEHLDPVPRESTPPHVPKCLFDDRQRLPAVLVIHAVKDRLQCRTGNFSRHHARPVKPHQHITHRTNPPSHFFGTTTYRPSWTPTQLDGPTPTRHRTPIPHPVRPTAHKELSDCGEAICTSSPMGYYSANYTVGGRTGSRTTIASHTFALQLNELCALSASIQKLVISAQATDH